MSWLKRGITCVVLTAAMAALSSASTPETMHIQGRLTNAALDPLRRDTAHLNDTIVVIPKDQISSISDNFRYRLEVTLVDSTRIVFAPPMQCCGVPFPILKPQEAWCRNRGYTQMGWIDNPSRKLAGGFPFVKLSELRHQLEIQDTTVVMIYPESLIRKIKHLSAWKSDPSLGIFVTNANRWNK